MRTALVILATGLMVSLGLVGLAGTTSADSGQFQPRRTLLPGGALATPAFVNQRPTLDVNAAQATAQALVSSVEGGSAAAEATSQALWDYAAGEQANPDAIVATAEAVASMSTVDQAAVDAAVEALLNDVPEWWYEDAEVSEDDLEALLEAWYSMGNIDVRWEGDQLIATITYSENGLNALVDAAIVLGEYPASDANVDLVSGGVIIDVYGLDTESMLTGNLSFYMLLAVNEEGRVTVDLVSASLNGRAVPQVKLDEVETLLVDTADVINLAMSLAYGVTYEVEELTITDDQFVATATILGLAAQG